MIGISTAPFEINYLRLLLNNVNTLEGLKPAQDYILEYFAHCINPVEVLMWCPEVQTFQHYSYKDFQRILHSEIIIIIIPGAKNWFHLISKTGLLISIQRYIESVAI